MGNETQIFDHYEDGEYKAVNVRRGAGKMGRLSDDSVYAEHNLYPVVGSKPVFNADTQTCTGPTRSFDEENKVSRLSWTVADIPLSTLSERLKADVTVRTQERLDDFARTKTYDSILSACTYATSAVERLKTEGQYCVSVRDDTWEKLYLILEEVESGDREMPENFSEIESELPVLVWP